MALIELDQLDWANGEPDFPYIDWKRALPFAFNPRGVLSHRVQAVYSTRIFEDRPPVTHVVHWCGNTALNLEFHSAPPESNPLCERCEKQAVKAGKLSAERLVGHAVWVGNAQAFRTAQRLRLEAHAAAIKPGSRVRVIDKLRIHYGCCGTVRQCSITAKQRLTDANIIVDFDNGDGAGVYDVASLESITTPAPQETKEAL